MNDEQDLSKLIELRRTAKDKLDELNRRYREKKAEIDGMLQQIDAQLLAYMNEQEIDSVRTSAGTVSKVRKVTPHVVDWEAFYDYVLKHRALHLLQKRIAQGNTLEIMKEEGRMLPGVHVNTEFVIRVQKPKEKA